MIETELIPTAASNMYPAMPPASLSLIETLGFPDYALLDSGHGRKLERFGTIVVDRPEPQALWEIKLQKAEWAQAHAIFSASGEDEEKGKWRVDKAVPESWPVRIPLGNSTQQKSGPGAVTMLCRMQGLWHLGLFPEQLPHWQWMLERIAAVKGETPRVLNLFAYTGAASLLAAAAGADVTHLDASKKAIAWGRENQAASNLDAAKVRWILDDAAKFVAREARRGKTYHVILVDPPKFGRGPEGEVWDLFTHLPGLMKGCAQLLAPQQASIVLTVYAIRASALAFDQLCQDILHGRKGVFESGELAIRAAGGNAVPTSLFTRWVGA
ncbi:MAG: class I SAM-dependent methyltransferase [Hyphomicrobium sp.]